MMSEYVKLFKGGTAKIFKISEEKHNTYRTKKKNGKWNIMTIESKELICSFDSYEEANNFYYEPHDIEIIWYNLRSQVYIEEGFTCEDMVKFISNNEILLPFVERNCPYFYEPHESGLYFIHATAETNKFNDELNFSYHVSTHEGSGIVLNPLCVYYGDEKSEHAFNFSLLDVIFALFGKLQNTVRITKNGIINDIGTICPFELMSANCVIDEDVVLGDIFNIVEKDEISCLFLRGYSWCNYIDDFHKSAKIPLIEKDEFTEKIWHLEIYRWINPKSDFDITPNFHGIGDVDEETASHFKDEIPLSMNYGVSFSPMNEIVNLPVVANTEVSFNQKIYNFPYTLLDILDAIYWEISFFGGPAEAEETGNLMQIQVQRIKENLESGLKFESVEDMLKSLKEDEEDED